MSCSPFRQGSWSPSQHEGDVEGVGSRAPLAAEPKHDHQSAYDSNVTHVTETQLEPDVPLQHEYLGDDYQSHATEAFFEPPRPVFVPSFLQRPPSSGDVRGSTFKMAPAKKQTLDLVGSKRFPSQSSRYSSQDTPPPSAQMTSSQKEQMLPPSQGPSPKAQGHLPSAVQSKKNNSPQPSDARPNHLAPTKVQSSSATSTTSQDKSITNSKAKHNDELPKTRRSKSSTKPKKSTTTTNKESEKSAALPRQLPRPAQDMPTPRVSSVQASGDILAPIPGLEHTFSDGGPYTYLVSGQFAAPHRDRISDSHSSPTSRHASQGGESRVELKQQGYTNQHKPMSLKHPSQGTRHGPSRSDSKSSAVETPPRVSIVATDALLQAHHSPKGFNKQDPGFRGPHDPAAKARGLTTGDVIFIDDDDVVPQIRPSAKEQRAKNPLQERRVGDQSSRTDLYPKAHHEHAKVEKPKKKPSRIQSTAIAPGGRLPRSEAPPAHSAENRKVVGTLPNSGNREPNLPQDSGSVNSSALPTSHRGLEASGHGVDRSEPTGQIPPAAAQPDIWDPAFPTDGLIKVLQDRSKAEKERMASLAATERAHKAQNASLSKVNAQLSEQVEKLSAVNAQCQERLRKFSAAMQGPDSKLAKHQLYMAGLGNDLDLLRSEFTSFLDTHRLIKNDNILLKEGLEEVAVDNGNMRDRVKKLRDPDGPWIEARRKLDQLTGVVDNLREQLEEKTGMLVTERDRNARLERKLERDAASHEELKSLIAGHRRSIMEKLLELHTVVDLAKAGEEEGNRSKLDECLTLIKDMRNAEKITPMDIENINSLINALSQGVFSKFDESDETLNQALTASRNVGSHLKNEVIALKADLQSQHELTEQINLLREENVRFGEEVKAGENALVDARQQITDLKSEKSDLHHRTTKLESEITALKTQPLDSPQTLHRLKDTEARNTELQDRLNEAQTELAKAEGKVQALIEDQNRLRPELADLKIRFEDCRATIASFDRQKVDLEKQAERKLTEIKVQFENEANAKVQQQKEDYDSRVRQLAQLRQAAEDRSTAAREEVESRRASETLALGKLSQLRGSEAALTIKGADLEKKNATLLERVHCLKEQIESQEVELQNYQESQASTDEELRQVNQSLETAYGEGKKDKALIITLRADAEGLRTQLANAETFRKQQSPRTSVELQTLRQTAEEAKSFREDTETFYERLRVALTGLLPSEYAGDDPLLRFEAIEKRLSELTSGDQHKDGPAVRSASSTQPTMQQVEAPPRRRANRSRIASKTTTSLASSTVASKSEASKQKNTPKVTFRTPPKVEKSVPDSQVPSLGRGLKESAAQRCPPATPNFARFEDRLQPTSPLTPIDEVDFVDVPSPLQTEGTAHTPKENTAQGNTAQGKPAAKLPQAPVMLERNDKNPNYDFSDESPPQEYGRRVTVEEKAAALAKRERQVMAAMAAYSPKTRQSMSLNTEDASEDDLASRYIPNIKDLFKQQPRKGPQSFTNAGSGQPKATLPPKAPLPSALKRKREGSDAAGARALKKLAKDSAVPEIPDSQSQGQIRNGMFQASSQTSMSAQSRVKVGQSDGAPRQGPRTRITRKRTSGNGQRYNLREERFNKELDN